LCVPITLPSLTSKMAMSLTDQPCTHSHASKSALAMDRSKYVRPPSLIRDLQPAPPRLEIDSRSHHSFFSADAKSPMRSLTQISTGISA
jgi:hypothetical protein